LLAGLALGFAGEGPSAAQDKPACEQFAWSVRREQALFGAPDLKTVPSGTALGDLPGLGIALELQPNARAAYVLPPARQPKTADSYGGVISANLPKAGAYRVTLSAEAWIDVIQDGKAAVSSAHTGKRDCADIPKSVQFELQPGPVTIQVSGAAVTSIKLAVLPAE